MSNSQLDYYQAYKYYKKQYKNLVKQFAGAKPEDCVGDYIFNPKSKRCVKRDGVVGRRVLEEASPSGHTKSNRSTTKAKAPTDSEVALAKARSRVKVAPTSSRQPKAKASSQPKAKASSQPKAKAPRQPKAKAPRQPTVTLAAIPKNCSKRHSTQESCEGDIDPDDEQHNCLWNNTATLTSFYQPIWETQDKIAKLRADGAPQRTIKKEETKLQQYNQALEDEKKKGNGVCEANYEKEEDDYNRLGWKNGINDVFLTEALLKYAEYKSLPELVDIWNNDIDGLRTTTQEKWGITDRYENTNIFTVTYLSPIRY
jgi:hypothetical protein